MALSARFILFACLRGRIALALWPRHGGCTRAQWRATIVFGILAKNAVYLGLNFCGMPKRFEASLAALVARPCRFLSDWRHGCSGVKS